MNIVKLRKEFISLYGRNCVDEQVYFSPGRVCLIGEHIDYNGGLVIPVAISLGIYAVARPTDNNILCLKSSLDGREFLVPISKDIIHDDKFGWANYPLGIVKHFLDNDYQLKGCEISFHSTLPVGSGLSSSAAIEVLTAFLLADLNDIQIEAKQLSLFAKDVENKFINVQCGIMDQFTVTFGKQNHAMKLNCSTLEYELLPFKLTQYKLVVFNTNKKRELTSSAFNKRAEECNAAYQILSKYSTATCLADCEEYLVNEYIEDETIGKRAFHVTSENKRVSKAANEIKKGNIENFGKLLYESHNSLRFNYEVSCRELDVFVEFAKQHPACIGAKMTGAGFGGCAVSLIKKDAVQHFISQALTDYKEKTGVNGDAYIVEISEGVRKL